MQINPDFSDLFSALNAADARYLVVGGYAFSFYAEPRYTKDIDLWVEPSPLNAEAVWAALAAFGAPMTDLSREELAQPGLVVQLGVQPNRVDIVTSIDGVAFADAWPNRVDSTYGAIPIHVIGRRELIQNKRACGRPQDLADLERLGR